MTESSKPREFWIETHESLKENKHLYTAERKWPQVYETSVVPNTIHVIEKSALDQALEKIKRLEIDYEGALSDMNEMKECIKLLEEKLTWLVGHSIFRGSISKARGADILGVSLIDLDDALITAKLSSEESEK